MSLKMFESKEAIPESLRESAVETKEGKWAVADVDGLKSSQERILDEKKKLQQRYEDLEKALGGLSPEQVAKFRADMAKLEEEQARKAGDFDKLLEKRIGETKAEYEKRLADAEQYRTKFIDREIEFAIRDAAVKAGVPAEDVPYVVDLHKGRRVRFDEKTGKSVVYDKDGDPTGLTVEKFYADVFKAEAPKFYGATVGSGGGSSGGGGRPVPAGQVAATDQSAFLANLDKIAKGEVKVATN
ncbi:MAG: hypothetical protein ACK6DP_12410 [Gemmatimonas sp.]|jgi:hypothetical protein|uniref:hypothetical protein n=1 Tax=Gemmatimonas sp. TaxID=1962908 RepID=UPI00391F7018